MFTSVVGPLIVMVSVFMENGCSEPVSPIAPAPLDHVAMPVVSKFATAAL
jgi:hypothetical protein